MFSFLSRLFITSEKKFLLPKRIILVRHGESLGNEDESAYSKTPDWKIGLTNRGEQQSKQAGQDLAELCRGERLFTYVSPYDRTMQTWKLMKEELQAPKSGEPLITLIGAREEPRYVIYWRPQSSLTGISNRCFIYFINFSPEYVSSSSEIFR
jgi:hypothetical protein